MKSQLLVAAALSALSVNVFAVDTYLQVENMDVGHQSIMVPLDTPLEISYESWYDCYTMTDMTGEVESVVYVADASEVVDSISTSDFFTLDDEMMAHISYFRNTNKCM